MTQPHVTLLAGPRCVSTVVVLSTISTASSPPACLTFAVNLERKVLKREVDTTTTTTRSAATAAVQPRGQLKTKMLQVLVLFCSVIVFVKNEGISNADIKQKLE